MEASGKSKGRHRGIGNVPENAAPAKGKHFYSYDTLLKEVETTTLVYMPNAGRDGNDESPHKAASRPV